MHDVGISDPRLARIVKSCQELPGQELFQFVDEDGNVRDIRSEDVNAYLREISGADYTAKDFRTWAGTVLAATALRDLLISGNQKPTKKNVTAAVQCVAHRLGNTPAVCRKCYIHPNVMDAFLEGRVIGRSDLRRRHGTARKSQSRTLEPDEVSVIKLLERQLTLEQRLSRALIRADAQVRPASKVTSRLTK